MNVIRTILFKDADRRITNLPVEELLTHLEYLGYISVERSDAEGMCVDFLPPREMRTKEQIDTWCRMNADKLSSYGHNAVVAPECPKR